MNIREITTACYENSIPAFVQGKLEKLYGSMYASFTQFSVYGGAQGASTYVACQGEEIKDIFLYQRHGKTVHVVNEQIHVSEEAMNRFAQVIFERYPGVDIISFHAVDAAQSKLAFPRQRFNCTNDITMPLPATVQDYYASLGKSTRKTLNQNSNRLQRRYPSFQFHVYAHNEVSEQTLRAIIALNHARMAGKSRTSAIDEEETARIIAFTKQCGLVGVITIDGKVRAGAICYRIGDHYHLRVIGHDPEYNVYGLGMLCCYRTICECVARGGTQYHFMWGHEEYKYRLLGVQRQLAHVALYRSRIHLLANIHFAMRTAAQGYWVQSRMWLLERLRPKNHWTGRYMNQCITLLRGCKRIVANLTPGGRKPVTLQLSQKE